MKCAIFKGHLKLKGAMITCKFLREEPPLKGKLGTTVIFSERRSLD